MPFSLHIREFRRRGEEEKGRRSLGVVGVMAKRDSLQSYTNILFISLLMYDNI
jgi:hypothetical protein